MKEKLYNPAGENDVTLKDGRRKNWFWDYNSVFKSSLSAHAKLVRLYLSQCANRDRVAWPSLKTIADACGISRATAKRAVSELVEGGWLQKILRRKESGEYISNAFVLCDPPEEFKKEVDQPGGRIVQTLPCNDLTGGVGSEGTGMGSHGTGVGSGRAINNTDITILKEQYSIATSHPSSHHDKDNNARAGCGKCRPVDSVDYSDGSPRPDKNPDYTNQDLQRIQSLLKSAGFEGSQVEVDFVGRWACLFPLEMIEYALTKSVLNGKKNLYYVEGIIDSWLEKGIKTVKEARGETRYDNYNKSVGFQVNR
ncbi:MAG: helix-turn-helix domain-containing protein [Actinobacteria bacterium]|nr:helix-turn-helix domain-containing protein [Actinomycetota bacterium]